MCLGGLCGRAQVFLIKGETPMLCGRPIIEALGVGFVTLVVLLPSSVTKAEVGLLMIC